MRRRWLSTAILTLAVAGLAGACLNAVECEFSDAACSAPASLLIEAVHLSAEVQASPQGTGDATSVVSVTPPDGASAVSTAAVIIVSFSAAMDAATVTGQTAPGACSGAVQVSSDGFATCIGFTTTTGATSDQLQFTFTPAANLAGATVYRVRVTEAALDANGRSVTPFAQPTGFNVAAPPVFYVYTDSATVTGLAGTRTASSSACATMQAASFPALTCTNHLQLISYDFGDSLSNAAANYGIPTTRPLISVGGTQIAPDWATFLNGPLTNTLQAAGVANITPTPYYWTQTQTGGPYDGTYNCSNNTNGSAGVFGSMGSITTTAGTHIRFVVNQPCDGSTNSAYRMCICWN